MKKLSLIMLSVVLFIACQEEESKPQITTFEPASGNMGDRVTITGINFSAETHSNVVKFGSIDAAVESATPTQLVVIVPPGAKTGTISVTVFGENTIMTETASSFAVTSGSWKKIADAPFIGDRSSIATFTIGQSAYLAYGETTPLGGTTIDAALWQYNQVSGIWTKKTPIALDFDQDHDSKAWAGSNGKGYMIASWGGLHEYNPDSDTWVEKASLTSANANYVLAAFTIGDYGYALLANRTLHQYSPISNTWGTIVGLTTLPVNINWVITSGGKAYISAAAGDMYEWSPSTPTTVTKIDVTMPAPVIQDPQIQGGTSQFAFAGDTYNIERDFFQYYVGEKRWVQKAPFVGDQRYWGVNFSIGSKFYYGLGAKTANDVLVKDLYEYTPE